MSEELNDIELAEQAVKEAAEQSEELRRVIARLKTATENRINRLALEQLKKASL